MSDLFISYAREDQERIAALVKALEQRGLSVFWDFHIPAGETWRSYIGKSLTDAGCVLVAWSQNSVDSNWVSEEADDGKRRGILIPILLDPVEPPLGFRSIQTADLSGWQPDTPSPSFEKLIADIHVLLQRESGAISGAAAAPPARKRWKASAPGASGKRAKWLSCGIALAAVLFALGYWFWPAQPAVDLARIPELGEPADGAQLITRTAVNLEWKAAAAGGSPVFEVQVARNEGFSPVLKSDQIQHYSYATFNFSEAEYGQLFWRVRQHFSDKEKGPWSKARAFTYYPSVLDRVIHTKRLRIGIESTRHEGIFASFKNNESTGIDIELVHYIIARLNERHRYGIAEQPEIVQRAWGDPLFNLPNSGEVDLIISAMTKTPEREQKYRIRFSDGYYTSHQTITVLSDSGIETVRDLAGKKLGAEEATTNLQMARALTGPESVKVFTGTDTATQMFRALLDGEIDGVCLDTHLALTRLIELERERRFRVFRLTPDKIPPDYHGPKTEEYALAVKASARDFLAQINPIIDEAKSSGVMDRLVGRFMPRPLKLDER